MEYALAVEATIPAKGLFINYVAIFWAIFNPPRGYIVYGVPKADIGFSELELLWLIRNDLKIKDIWPLASVNFLALNYKCAKINFLGLSRCNISLIF